MPESCIIAHRTSHIASSCPICQSTNLKTIDTIISDFVMSRIADEFTPGNNYPVKLCFCKDCTFAFFDYRMNDEEISRLYASYRDAIYQKTRERFECWYTEKVNDALNNDIKTLNEQKKVISQIISKNIHREIKIALDYGGNEGRTFFDSLGTKAKYVFDISGVSTIEGVQNISRYDDLKQHNFDFIMCNHLFEHLSDPLSMMQKLRQLGNEHTTFYIEVPSQNPFMQKSLRSFMMRNFTSIFRLAYTLRGKRIMHKSMSEHINFFTPKSIRTMAELSGFEVIDVQENLEHSALRDMLVLSMLFKL